MQPQEFYKENDLEKAERGLAITQRLITAWENDHRRSPCAFFQEKVLENRALSLRFQSLVDAFRRPLNEGGEV